MENKEKDIVENYDEINEVNTEEAITDENMTEGNENFEEENCGEDCQNPEKAPLKNRIMKEVWYWVKTIVILLIISLVLKSFVFTVADVNGESMEPTLQDNDRLIIWRLAYQPKQDDIVVFESDLNIDEMDYWIKRVIATEGQKVHIDYAKSEVYVDGKKIDEPYLGEKMADKGYDTITDMIVPEDCVFVMGDNRNNSTDSRYIGPIKEDKIIGKAVLRFWPFSEFETY